MRHRISCQLYICRFKRLLLVASSHEVPCESRQSSTDERTYDEYPKLRQRLTTLEQCRSDGTSRVNGCARVTDTCQVNQYEAETDCQASEITSALAGVGSAQHGEYEHAREEYLREESTRHVHARLQAVRTCAFQTCVRSEQIKNCGAKESTQHLEQHVHARILRGNSLGEQASQRDGRIDVTSADATDRIGHRNDSQTEGYRSTYNTRSVHTATQTYSSSATHKNQDHGSYHFS